MTARVGTKEGLREQASQRGNTDFYALNIHPYQIIAHYAHAQNKTLSFPE